MEPIKSWDGWMKRRGAEKRAMEGEVSKMV
jgi:hypothetical protein